MAGIHNAVREQLKNELLRAEISHKEALALLRKRELTKPQIKKIETALGRSLNDRYYKTILNKKRGGGYVVPEDGNTNIIPMFEGGGFFQTPFNYNTDQDTVNSVYNNMMNATVSPDATSTQNVTAQGNGGGFNYGSTMNAIGGISQAVMPYLNKLNKADYKTLEDSKLNVENNVVEKGLEKGLGSFPITAAFMAAGKLGEAGLDKVKGGLGEAVFAPHKGILRAIQTKDWSYAIPFYGNIKAAKDAENEAAKRKRDEYMSEHSAPNPFGNLESGMLKMGGLVKYNGAKHEQGGIPIGDDMQPVDRKNAVAEVEDGETSYKDYVYSDTLKDTPKKTFADTSKSIERSYANRDDKLAQKTMNLQLRELMRKNELAKLEMAKQHLAQQEQKLKMGGKIYKCGGKLHRYDNGGYIDTDGDGVPDTYQQPDGTMSMIGTPNNNLPYGVGVGQLGINGEDQNYTAKRKMSSSEITPIQFKDSGIDNLRDVIDITSLKANASKVANPYDANYSPRITPDDYGDVMKVQDTLDSSTGDTSGDEPYVKEGKEPWQGYKHYLSPFIAGKGIEMLGKGIMLATGYDKEKPNMNPYADKVRKLMNERNIDYTALLNQNNLQRNYAMEQARDSARSVNVQRALQHGIYSTAADKAAQLKLAERQANMGYRGEESAALQQLGEYDRQAVTLSKELNARNKGQWLTNIGTYLGDIGRAGEFGTKVRLNDMQIKEGMKLLGDKYEDFKLTDAYKRIMNGTYTNEDIIAFRENVEASRVKK